MLSDLVARNSILELDTGEEISTPPESLNVPIKMHALEDLKNQKIIQLTVKMVIRVTYVLNEQ